MEILGFLRNPRLITGNNNFFISGDQEHFIILIFVQGGALGAMLDLFQCLVSANSPVLTYSDLLSLLVNPVLGARGADIHKQGRANIAKCVASLVSSNKQQVVKNKKRLIIVISIRVADPLYFDADPDPWIRIKKYGSGSGSLDPYKKYGSGCGSGSDLVKAT